MRMVKRRNQYPHLVERAQLIVLVGEADEAMSAGLALGTGQCWRRSCALFHEGKRPRKNDTRTYSGPLQ